MSRIIHVSLLSPVTYHDGEDATHTVGRSPVFKPEYIVWHTAAHGSGGEDYDTTAAQIDAWHKDRGWRGIGYHYVVRKNGLIEEGRPIREQGAHVLGLNNKSLGICFSGHGDISAHTAPQRQAGIDLTKNLMEEHNIPAENVIGHREVNLLIKQGHLLPRYMTTKSCPGKLVDMGQVRSILNANPQVGIPGYSKQGAERLLEALKAVYAAVEALALEESLDELNAFRREPHIDAVIARLRSEGAG